ncbi:GMC family oxidoreductase [Sphingobium subterraneum]|uniref:Choline dehydrogenase n=1 Tax=Sphingobium subterraneum TaxID=627688 RepID=A0A841J7R4_9SPHN|nr:choline dehydrogenase [Sphingobium subterraneum]MBB6124221.1 choline dehydrogenase [Sphingobium subterraneum]
MDELDADYVIVGAGSAGCVLANRLSADPGVKVLLLEAGGDDRPTKNLSQFYLNMMIHMPAGFMKTIPNPKTAWHFHTEPDPGTKDRVHMWPRGKVLGGSSSVNGMLYVRGQHADYDGWRQMGCDSWSWDDVRPYFIRAEHQERGADEWHGHGGPLNVCDMLEKNAVSDAVIDACEQAGIPRNPDINGAEQEGVGYFQSTSKNGRRCSTSTAYLHPAMHRRNLRVVTNALTTRVQFEGKRAVGVEFIKDGIVCRAGARREVILSGGAINSPQLLQLSGIGPGELLRRYGIEVRVDSPNTGGNLQDHILFQSMFRLQDGAYSLNERTHGLKFLGEVLTYAVKRQGLLSSGTAQVVAFCKSRPELAHPDVQFHFLAATMDIELFARTQRMELEKKPGITIAPCQVRPESRGTIQINSADPKVAPTIRPNYLSDSLDQEVAVASMRLARRIANEPALQRWITHEITPGPQCSTDEELLDYARMTGASVYHPVGTCAMGGRDTDVLDPQLRVRGVEGLRVVDASVMPRIPSGNTNAPTIMVAEKAADIILGKSSAS